MKSCDILPDGLNHFVVNSVTQIKDNIISPKPIALAYYEITMLRKNFFSKCVNE